MPRVSQVGILTVAGGTGSRENWASSKTQIEEYGIAK
jgi:hypothetical protein